MFTILLIIIYLSFISLGLPDALLGSAWPVMYGELKVPISYAGIVSMIIAGGTIISSLQSTRIIKKFGTGIVTVVSVGMTAIALFGFSISSEFWMLCLWAIPYGLGAGSVDAALNNFVALHYKAKHMSWLHCFWGIGATAGPYIMGYCLTGGMHWGQGYRGIFWIQIVLTGILVFSLPLWRKTKEENSEEEIEVKSLRLRDLIQVKGAMAAVVTFFAYCAIESSTGLWGSSFMVNERGISAETAAKWTSLFYLGITIGRFLCGFITMKVNDKNMIRLGQGFILLGVIGILFPFPSAVLCAGFVLVGLGCAPIYPSMIHATPINFGKEFSQAMIGIQMACAYMGSTFVPPIVGFFMEHVNMKLYPYFLGIILLLMIIMSESLNRANKSKGEKRL